jgi:energy-coupling factor transporter ATP-binding protein EcfA2
MTTSGLDLLNLLNATHAFDPVALPGYRTFIYVPFERLLGGRHESRLASDIANGQRIALIGPIGCGKSSMVEYVMGTGEGEFAPIWISAAHEGEHTLKDPPEFARHLIRQLVGWARDAGAMTSDERDAFLIETSRTVPGRTTRYKQTVSFKLALKWIEPGWSEEVERTLANPDVARNRGDFVASLGRLVELIREDLQRTPVVIIDDSDRWLRLDPSTRESLIDSFFTETCRMLAELDWAVVMAVHPEYCSSSPFRSAAANGYFNVQLSVPPIDRPEALRELLDVRIRALASAAEEARQLEAGIDPGELQPPADTSVDDVLEPGFETVLLEYCAANDNNLRAVLTVVQQALQETIGLGEDTVTTAAIREAGLALAP